jgi:hypothetical protein
LIAPIFDGSFSHNWTAEVLPNRPMILPSRSYVFPQAVEEVEKGALEVLVQPGLAQSATAQAGKEDTGPLAQPFLATCALGFRDPAAPSGLWSMPNPNWLCAVSGGYAYLINVVAPEQFKMIEYRPVLQVLPLLQQRLLLFIGHHSILAWGPEGEAWQSERLSWEGITILRVEEDVLHGHGWDLRTDKDLPFVLDLKTGKSV